MATLSPFHGWLVTSESADRVISPAYDVLTAEERRQHAMAQPDSFLNVLRSPDDQPPGAATDQESLLAASRATLDRLLEAGAFAPTDGPVYLVLRMELGDHVQTGIVGTVPVADIGATVRLHESTRAEKEDALASHLEVVGVSSSPVGLIHPGPSPVADLLDRVTSAAPSLDVRHDDDLRQQVWVVEDVGDRDRIAAAFGEMPALYVTDGHHRAAAARRYAERCRDGSAVRDHQDDGCEHLLVVAFPAPELLLYPYHRVVADRGGLTTPELLTRAAERFIVEELDVVDPDDAAPTEPHSFALHVEGRWYRLKAGEGATDPDHPVAELDVSVLQDHLLGPVLGVADPRTDPRLSFVPGTLGLDELVKRTGPEGVAIAVPPTAVEQLVAVADAGEVMPPKSTWFDPKVRSGVFLRRVHPEVRSGR